MQASKWRELLEELRTVFTGRNSFFDAILPPIVFLLINGLVGFQAAMGSALILAVGIASLRVIRKQSLVYALERLGAVDLGGYRVTFSPTNHNGSKYVDMTVITKDARFRD